MSTQISSKSNFTYNSNLRNLSKMRKGKPNNPFGQALLFCLQQKGITRKTLADKIYKSPSAIHDYIYGRRHGPEETRRKIADFFGYSYEDFLSLGRHLLKGGSYEAWEEERKYRLGLGNVEPGPDLPARVPLISWVQAGKWMEVGELLQPAQAEQWIYTTKKVGPRAFALRIHGDSMEPEFIEGDIVIVDPDIQPASGHFIIASLDAANEATIKQLRIDGQKVYLVPKNARYPIMDMTETEFRIVGVVVGKFKEYV